MLNTALILFFPFFMAFAAASDLVSMTISNKVSAALIAGFVAFAFATGMPLPAIGMHFLMFTIVLLAGFALFSFGAIGGGDAKLAASTALWFGWEHSMPYLTVAAFFGGILALLLLRLRSAPLPDRVSKIAWIARLYRADQGIPYGVALGAAAIFIYPQTHWMRHVFDAARSVGG